MTLAQPEQVTACVDCSFTCTAVPQCGHEKLLPASVFSLAPSRRPCSFSAGSDTAAPA